MTKTVCDICGCDNKTLYRCELPMYRKYEMTSIELSEVDLCSEHYIMLADFIETMKEDSNVL